MNYFKNISLLIIIVILCNTIIAQKINGKFDDISELTTKSEYAFTMPDGTKLMTDVYLPVTSDSLTLDFEMPGFGTVNLEIIPKGVQYIIYDSIDGHPNENPYQLPIIFTRTPYNKAGGSSLESLFSLMGYAYVLQDMRGRYASEGVYLPMYSDSWNKNPYHPEQGHLLDITELSDPRNGNNHEDGYNSIQFINDSLYREYEQDSFLISIGKIGMIGASALGNTQYQAASAHLTNFYEDGLKCLFPIVATNENYNSTGYHNGVYRQSLIEGWVNGQMSALDESIVDIDTSISNNLHSPADFGLLTENEVKEKAIKHFTSHSYNGLPPAYYPNSTMRYDMDASIATTNYSGEGDIDGENNRYYNMNIPIYHLSGWWDIFTNGQIDTYNHIRKFRKDSSTDHTWQKLIIGPWAHQTVGSRTTGDITYPENVNDFIFEIDKAVNENGETNMNAILNSDVLTWFRMNLNYDWIKPIGEPKVRLPESDKWQTLTDQVEIRFPSDDYIISFPDFINYLAGYSGLPDMPLEFKVNEEVNEDELSIPALETPARIPCINYR